MADVLRVPLRVIVKTRSAAPPSRRRSRGMRPAPRAMPQASANEGDGEIDLLAYARQRFFGTESP